MATFRITYLDKYEQSHCVDYPAPDPETAITAIEEELDEQITVKKIEILDEEDE